MATIVDSPACMASWIGLQHLVPPHHGIDERYAREWLEQQAVAGFVVVDDDAAHWTARRYDLNDDLDHIPSIIPSRDREPHHPGGNAQPRASNCAFRSGRYRETTLSA